MLEGDLSDFTLPDILRLLAFTAKTGRLHIEGERQRGRVDLIEGRVRDASADAEHLPVARRMIGLGHVDGETLVSVLQGHEQLPSDLELARELVRDHGFDPGLAASLLREQTVDAVFDLLRWERGSFRFEIRPGVDSAPPDLDLKVDDLLAEADQRLEAWPTIEQRTGAGSAVVTIGRPDGPTPDIDAEGWGLLALVDGHRTVDDLVQLSGRGQFETRRTLGSLADLGIVRIGDAGRGGAVDQLIAAHRALERVESALPASTPAMRPEGPDAGGSPSSQGDYRPGPATEPQPQRPAAPQYEPRTSAQRTPPGGWEDDAPSDLPPPTGAPNAPSLGQREPSADEPAPEAPASASRDRVAQDPGATSAYDSGVPPPERSSTPPAQDAGARDDSLRMRVRSERLTTDPSVDADLVSRLIDGVEGL